jgi:hypothetical protein
MSDAESGIRVKLGPMWTLVNAPKMWEVGFPGSVCRVKNASGGPWSVPFYTDPDVAKEAAGRQTDVSVLRLTAPCFVRAVVVDYASAGGTHVILNAIVGGNRESLELTCREFLDMLPADPELPV